MVDDEHGRGGRLSGRRVHCAERASEECKNAWPQPETRTYRGAHIESGVNLGVDSTPIRQAGRETGVPVCDTDSKRHGEGDFFCAAAPLPLVA